MFADPNFSSPANVDASVELRKKPDAYKKRIRALVEKSKKELPEGFEMPKPKKIVPPQEETFDPFDEDFNVDDDDDGVADDDDDNVEDDDGADDEDEE